MEKQLLRQLLMLEFAMEDVPGNLCGYVYISSSNSFLYYCLYCENSFESSKEFQNHNLELHLEENCLEDVKNSTKCTSDLDNESIEFDSMEIPKDNSNKSIDPERIKSTEDSEKNNVSTMFPYGVENLDEVNLRCRYCEKQFSKKESLLQHTKNHLSFMLTCWICGQHSSNRRLAQDHKKTHSKVQCDLCDISFSTAKALANHKNRHEKLKCKYCFKILKEPNKLTNHLRTHTGEKPYKCDYCSIAFALKRNLQAHIITQHTGDIRNFSCKFCSRKFKTKELYSRHIKAVHLKEKPHQCEFCGIHFSSRSGLGQHKLTHHTEYDERPHHCSLCDKKFIRFFDLTEHMNTHTGERPFQCNICSKNFRQQRLLTRHKKLHNNKRPNIKNK